MMLLEHTLILVRLLLELTKVFVNGDQANCTFERDLCGWTNEKQSDDLDWIRYRGSSPTKLTGPSRDFSGDGYDKMECFQPRESLSYHFIIIGNGHYIYIHSGNGSPRDKARLKSPLMTGTQCMTFYYNFYGQTMSCVIVYIKTTDGTEKVVWIKSGHWGDRWIKTQIEISEEKASYRIIVEGVRGSSHLGDAALDQFHFINGSCQQARPVFRVMSTREDNNNIYRVHAVPAHDQWLHMFSFTTGQSRCKENDTMYFIYPPSRSGKSIISSTLHLNDSDRFPNDFFIAGRNEHTNDIFELTINSNISNKITVSNQSTDCCYSARTSRIPVILLPESNRSCYPGWKAVGSTCLRFFVNTRRTWDGARAFCRRLGGDLALPKMSEPFSTTLTELLMLLTNAETDLYVGFLRSRLRVGADKWVWNDGKTVDGQQFKRGYPMNGLKKSCGALSKDDMKLLNTDCSNMNGFICESYQVNVIKYKTDGNDVFEGNVSVTAADQSQLFGPLFQREGSARKWIITLTRRIWVFSATVDMFISCCDQHTKTTKLLVSDGNMFYIECEETAIVNHPPTTFAFRCTPPRSGSQVLLELLDHQWNPPINSVAVSGFDSIGKAHGTSRELWYRYVNTEGFATLRENPIFEQPPDGYTTTFKMSAAFEVSDNYGERLTAYLKVPKSGNYTLSLSCGDECELWYTEYHEEELSFEEKLPSNSGLVETMLIQLRRWTIYDEPDRCLRKEAKSGVYLNKCRLYALQVYMKEEMQFKCLSVGISDQTFIKEEPIQGNHLYAFPPASYKYCCQGMYCPDCPLLLEFHAFGNKYLVNPHVNLTCSENMFEKEIDVIAQPGVHSLKIYYSFTNDSTEWRGKQKVADVMVKVATISKLASDNIQDWTLNGWMVSGGVGLVNELPNGKIESPLLPWKPFYVDVGLCLRFKFTLSTHFHPSLNVFIKTPQQTVLIWKLRGHQGNEPNIATVSWKPLEKIQIIFEVLGSANSTPNIVVDNITITTETCALTPSHASPDFACSPNDYQCDNGECTSSSQRCDNDVNCMDGSDEKGCTCLTVELSCSTGSCVPSNKLCNGFDDCSDGKDEKVCGATCPSNMFQCVDGTCIPWSSTCRRDNYPVCQDDTHQPSICTANDCPLNNLKCKDNSSSRNCDKYFRGHCSFENGFCGLKHDKNTEFQWLLNSGKTSSAHTGPSYDHTTFSEKGAYIYIEASNRLHGDRARLTSDWLKPNKIICLQFWYHMFGKHIGELIVYMATHSSETIVWHVSGNQGNSWLPAQTTLQADSRYKFILEGVSVEGNEGDIAIDDITVLDESCHTNNKWENPHCYFDDKICNWDMDGSWFLKELSGSRKGGFLSLRPEGKTVKGTITSPVFSGNEWKCMRFWYRIESGRDVQLRVFLNVSDALQQLWTTSHRKTGWNFVQLPINAEGTTQIAIAGTCRETSIDIDDVSFSKQRCNEIPWAPYQEFLPPLLPDCLSPLGMQDGRILNSAITASSYYRRRSAPNRARLHMALPDKYIPGGFTGGWCQYPSSKYQWLQVDFGFIARVGKVATQGKQEFDFWVTKYFLAYKRDSKRKRLLYRQHGNVQIFDGNFDRHTVVSHHLVPRITAQFVRIYPYKFNQFGCLRVEYYGCPADEADKVNITRGIPLCYAPLGMQNGQIPNASVTASSNFGSAHRARLYTVAEGGKPGAWVAAVSDTNQWLQIDLGTLAMIKRLDTQGRHGVAEWVSSFTLSYSSVESNFKFYAQIFKANRNQNTIAVNTIIPSILARFLRIHPRTWVNGVALRIEIYGCFAVNMYIEKIIDKGCYKDYTDRTLASLETTSPLLDGSYMQRAAAIRRCAKAAYDLQLNVFAIQNGGQCMGGIGTRLNYNRYGKSTQCQENGRGGPWANQVYEIKRKCNLSDEWCDWMSQNDTKTRWSLAEAADLVKASKAIAEFAYNFVNKENLNDRQYVLETSKNRPQRITTPVSIGTSINAMTVCYWLQDNFAIFSLKYASGNDAEETPSFSLHQSLVGVKMNVKESVILSHLSVERNVWHHVCASWSSQLGFWKIYKDGKLFDFDRWLSSEQVISGSGVTTIEFQQGNQTFSSRLTGVNMWDHNLGVEEVYRLSLGCGQESGNILRWFDLRNKVDMTEDEKEIKEPACSYRDGVMAIVSHDIAERVTLVSPWNNRSADKYGSCLKFRFLMFGPGAKGLEIHQQLEESQWPIWKDSDNMVPYWRHGQVSLSSLARSKVIIKGDMERVPGYIAVGGLSWVDGYCESQPVGAANQACRKTLMASSGFILSPYYPGFYAPNSSCNWLITAPVGHVIRLEVLDFQLERDPRCATDHLEVTDGNTVGEKNLGRYCGDEIPKLMQSTRNTLHIAFRSDMSVQRTGFKIHYSFKVQAEDSACSSKRDCPSGCSCFQTTLGNFFVQGFDLRTVPGNMPSYTKALLFANNRINLIQEKAFSNLPLLEYIDLSRNVILMLADSSFQGCQNLKTIRLTGNFVRKLSLNVFSHLDNLEVLDLGENLLTVIPEGTFSHLLNLRVVSLRSNEIRSLEMGMFSQRCNLTYLYLQDNLIEVIPDKLFNNLGNLKVLYLNNNKIKRISMHTFEGLISLHTLYLDNNRIVDLPAETFHALGSLRKLTMDHFTHCCYAVRTIPQLQCDAPADGFSSCDDLMKNKTLQIFIWILGILAFAGNLIVVLWRCFLKEDNRVHSFLLTNLAISDFLMGIYLLIIAIKDTQWQGVYFKHDLSWRRGKLCQFAGVLSMVSSEVSVAMLTIITADRLICIVFSFRFRRLSFKRACFLCTVVWLLGIMISTVPLMGIDYFNDTKKGVGFYGRSAVCLPLQLSSDRPAGWEYSVSFFIAFNFVAFMFMLVSYIAMFVKAKKIGGAVRSTNVRNETAMATKMMFIILTDFFCWIPVIIIGILSLTGRLYDPKQLVYVWIAVFVLPVNSSINPLLYTFSTTASRKKLKTLTGTMSSFVRRTHSSGGQGRLDTHLDITLSTVTPNLPDRKTAIGKTDVKIIEFCNIFNDCSSNQSMGYATCWVEKDSLEMCLLKYFTRSKEKDWKNEIEILKEIAKNGAHDNLIAFRWHSEVCDVNIGFQTTKLPSIKNASLLICFAFVSSTSLSDFLDEGVGRCEPTITQLLIVLLDVVKAVEHLHKTGICHNNISPSNVLVSFNEGVRPVKGVLGNFGRAFLLKQNDNSSFLRQEDLRQFRKLMETVVGYSNSARKTNEIKEILALCKGNEDDTRDATHIRETLQRISSSLKDSARF